MDQAYIVAAEMVVDGVGGVGRTRELAEQLRSRGGRVAELIIEPLAAGWDSPLAPGHFRSGCGPVEALAAAAAAVGTGRVDAVRITGRDPLRSGYTRAARHRLMNIYGDDYPLLQAYTDLAQQFLERHGLGVAGFRAAARQLFTNYLLSYRARSASAAFLPAGSWYGRVTPLFRGVDCANPVVDFSGGLLVSGGDPADALGVPAGQRARVAGVGLEFLDGPETERLEELAAYAHLARACRQAEAASGHSIGAAVRDGRVALEVYTCYPVVPLGFLLASGVLASLDELEALLARRPLTLSGGLNLARAPWNNPVLRALVLAYRRLAAGHVPLAILHGNGGLGSRQGVAILAGPSAPGG